MARHPPAQSLAFRDRPILQQVGVQADRESAAQVLVSAPHEQRTRRERHERAELRADERHRFGKAHASAHRLRDFIQRVCLPLGRCDLGKRIGTKSLPIVGGKVVGSRDHSERRIRRRKPSFVGGVSTGTSFVNSATMAGSSALPASP